MSLVPQNVAITRKRTIDEIGKFLLNSAGVEVGVDEPSNDDISVERLHHHDNLENLLCQLESECSSKTTHLPQQKIRIHRQISTKILDVIEKLILNLTTTRRDRFDDRKQSDDNIRTALNVLVELWGPGDEQIYTSLIKTLLQSYLVALSPNRENVLFENVSLQQFILLDLLPSATGSGSESCHHAQSVIANALLQALSICSNDCRVYQPIVSWCKWYINYHYHHEPHSTVRNEFPSNDAACASFSLPSDIHLLGLELFRTVPSMDLLPTLFSVVLDHLAIMLRYDSMSSSLLQQHAEKIVVTLRLRWIELMLPRQFQLREAGNASSNKCTLSEETRILECQLHLVYLFDTAASYKDKNRENLLTDAYLKLLHTYSESDNECSTSPLSLDRRRKRRKSNFDFQCNDHTRAEQNILTLDWVFIIMLLSSSQYQPTAISIVDTWCKGEPDSYQQSHGIFDALSEVIKITFLDRYPGVEISDKTTDLSLYISSSIFDTIKCKHTQQRLVPCLLQLATVLILNPQRDYYSYQMRPVEDKFMQNRNELLLTSQTLVHRFIPLLFRCLDCHRQKELVNMLLHVTDECLCHHGVNVSVSSSIDVQLILHSRNEARSEQNTVLLVVQSIFTILQQVTAENLPISLHLKSKLMERLIMPMLADNATPANKYVERESCILLASLMDPLATMRDENSNALSENNHGFSQSEVLLLLQKMLLAESSHGDSSRAIRGLLLATALISTKSYAFVSTDDRKSIEELIFRRLLPCTRRMLEPDLGLAGLIFLRALIDSNVNDNVGLTKSAIFQRFKLMVANTGLIQIMDNDRATGKAKEAALHSRVVLAYSRPVIEDARSRDHKSARAILFGVHFFLRHSSEISTNPLLWSHAADWVYALVDTYLQMGRTKISKSWCPISWLRAPLEFPTIDISYFTTSNDAQRLVVEWIDQSLCRFDLPDGAERIHSLPVLYADVIVRRLFSKKLMLFIDSLKCFALALLIGISLSSAVLKNAFEQTKVTSTHSLDFHKSMKLQLIKIYDLKAKSTTMDSMFLSIHSALRRSLLRKRRSTVILTDDAANSDHNSVVVPSKRKLQQSTILNNLSETLHYTHRIRRAIFASTTYIESDILWSTLKDPSDSKLIRIGLDSLTCYNTDREPPAFFSELSQMIKTKLNILQHILQQLENISLCQPNINFCFFEISLFVTDITKLRKICDDVRIIQYEAITSLIHESLVQMVRLTSSYLRVIAICLQRAHCPSELTLDFEKSSSPVIDHKELLKQIDGFQSNTQESDTTGRTIVRLFDYFADLLRSTEYAEVADSILEVLSTIGLVEEKNELLIRLFELSWIHLHTVYIHTVTEEASDVLPCPYAIEFSLNVLARQSYTMEQQSSLQIVNRILSKVWRNSNLSEPFLHLNIGMIRHWGILTASRVGFPFLLQNLSTLATSLKTLLESLDASVMRKAEFVDNDNIKTTIVRKKISSKVSNIVGLEVATFPEYFETIFNLAIAATGTLSFSHRMNDPSGSPYQDLQECFTIVHSLIDMYKAHMHLYPRKCALMISCGLKEILVIAVHQLQLCVERRIDQPSFSSPKQTMEHFAFGSVCSIQELMDRIVSDIVEPILLLCDVWQTSTYGKVLSKSKISALRFTVEKAVRQIEDISHLHTMSNPSLGMVCDKLEIDNDETAEGFHLRPHSNGFSKTLPLISFPFGNFDALDDEVQESRVFDLGKINDDEENDIGDEDSFGVMGNWGNGSNVDADTDSTCSLNLEHSVTPSLSKD